MNEVYKPPHYANSEVSSIFLAGSIEMGVATDWQDALTAKLTKFLITDTDSKVIDLEIYNPRRDEWDSSWEQTLNNPKFYEQVTWELDHLEKADHIVMYFQGDTLSPISLLEFGMYAKTGKLIVACEPDFWRRGNVEVVCEVMGVHLFDNLDALEVELRRRILQQFCN